jgi:hypothetical protein
MASDPKRINRRHAAHRKRRAKYEHVEYASVGQGVREQAFKSFKAFKLFKLFEPFEQSEAAEQSVSG